MIMKNIVYYNIAHEKQKIKENTWDSKWKKQGENYIHNMISTT